MRISPVLHDGLVFQTAAAQPIRPKVAAPVIVGAGHCTGAAYCTDGAHSSVAGAAWLTAGAGPQNSTTGADAACTVGASGVWLAVGAREMYSTTGGGHTLQELTRRSASLARD